MTATEVWFKLDLFKKEAVNLGLSSEQLMGVKEECDSLFMAATGNPVHPAYWIGGWRDVRGQRK